MRSCRVRTLGTCAPTAGKFSIRSITRWTQQGVRRRAPGAVLRTRRSQPAIPPRRLPRSERASSLAERSASIRRRTSSNVGLSRTGIQSFAPAFDLRRPRLFHSVSLSLLSASRLAISRAAISALSSSGSFRASSRTLSAVDVISGRVPARNQTAKRRAEPADRARREENARLIGTALALSGCLWPGRSNVGLPKCSLRKRKSMRSTVPLPSRTCHRKRRGPRRRNR